MELSAFVTVMAMVYYGGLLISLSAGSSLIEPSNLGAHSDILLLT